MKRCETDHTSDEDVSLMLAFGRGDEEAFVSLYRRYRDRMVNFARRLLGNRAQAEEAAQEVFLKLYRARDRYVPRSRFSTYLFRIATNHCLNLKARHAYKLEQARPSLEETTGREGSQTAAVARAELRRALGAGLAKLPDSQRTALVLCHYQGLSYREAAEVMDLTSSALKSLVHRARERMTQELASFLDPASPTAKAGHAV